MNTIYLFYEYTSLSAVFSYNRLSLSRQLMWNNRLSRNENLVRVLTWKQNIVEK